MSTSRPRPDPHALAAQLRLWAVELVAWLVEVLGDSALGAALHRWAKHSLDRAERGAEGIVVLAALALLPSPHPLPQRGGARPAPAPPGFVCARLRGNDMRRLTRRLFPRERDLLARGRRLNDFLGALGMHARRLARRIDHAPATVGRLLLVSPPAMACVDAASPGAMDAPDTS